jgi:tetratricopeptide (TPR) repeat protein
VLAIGANGLVESNLSFFGIRMALFALLGIGMNLSVDGLVPERVPVALRAVVASLLAVGVGYTLVGAAVSDNAVSRALAVMSDRPGEAQRLLLFAKKVAPADPQPTFQLAKLASAMNDWESARNLAETAAMRNPDASSYSLLARAEAKLGSTTEAIAAMDAAIAAEPNDPYWRAQKFELLRDMAMYDDAETAALDAIEAEDRLASVPNALPWLVPTDTVTARRWLISRAKSTPERVALLQGLFDRLALYAERTATELANVTGYAAIVAAKKELGAGVSEQKIADEFGMTIDDYRAYRQSLEQTQMVGESIELARQKQELLFDTGEELERIYRSEGDSEEADAVKARLDAVEEAGVLK